MKVLIDTNILLDVLLDREEFADESQVILDWCEAHPDSGWIAWHTLANLYYIGVRIAGKENAERFVDEVLEVFEICAADTLAAKSARSMPIGDFEDALQVAAAQKAQLDAIITRNKKDFRGSVVPALLPKEFLESQNLGP